MAVVQQVEHKEEYKRGATDYASAGYVFALTAAYVGCVKALAVLGIGLVLARKRHLGWIVKLARIDDDAEQHVGLTSSG